MSDSGKIPLLMRGCNNIVTWIYPLEIPELCKDSDSENSDGWDELEGSDGEDCPPVACLFCDTSYKNIKEAVNHVEKDHKFSFMDLQIKFNMDQYSFIKVGCPIWDWVPERSRYYLSLPAGELHPERTSDSGKDPPRNFLCLERWKVSETGRHVPDGVANVW